jgi:Streptomyces sporulation and cell division protein, SsgA
MPRVSAVVGLRLLAVGREVPVSATFSYDTSDPYEVRAVFRTGLGEPVEWVFARCLLAGGLDGRAGTGDVRVWRYWGGRVIGIGLSSPHGEARFEAPAGSIARFLDATYRLVPDRAEPARADLDAGIAAILAEGGPQ